MSFSQIEEGKNRASVERSVRNHTDCTMHFGGFFYIGGTAIKMVDWGSGIVIDSGKK